MAENYPPIGYVSIGAFGRMKAEPPACQHNDTAPVDSVVLGASVAELCLTCDEQLPVPWPEDTP